MKKLNLKIFLIILFFNNTFCMSILWHFVEKLTINYKLQKILKQNCFSFIKKLNEQDQIYSIEILKKIKEIGIVKAHDIDKDFFKFIMELDKEERKNAIKILEKIKEIDIIKGDYNIENVFKFIMRLDKKKRANAIEILKKIKVNNISNINLILFIFKNFLNNIEEKSKKNILNINNNLQFQKILEESNNFQYQIFVNQKGQTLYKINSPYIKTEMSCNTNTNIQNRIKSINIKGFPEFLGRLRKINLFEYEITNTASNFLREIDEKSQENILLRCSDSKFKDILKASNYFEKKIIVGRNGKIIKYPNNLSFNN